MSHLGLAFMPSGWEWIILLVIALLIFGARLPKIMRGMGSSVREFKAGMDEGEKKPEGPGSDKDGTKGA